MKKAKKILALLLVAAMLVAALSACAKKEDTKEPDSAGLTLGGGKDIYNDTIKISMISLSTAGVVNGMIQRGLKEQLLIYPNVSVDFKDAEYDPNKQITLIQEAVTQNYDAIIIEAMDPELLNKAITEAEEAGIPVITTNAANATATHTLHLQGSDYATGWQSGIELAKMTDGKGTAIILDCPAEQKVGARMGTGFQEYIEKETDIELLELVPIANWTADNANTAMRDMLTKYDDITMVYCASDDIALGATNAIQAAGRSGDGILVWGFCGYPMGLQGVKDGTMAGTMFSDVYVQYAAAMYFAMFFIQQGITSATAGFPTTPIIDQPMFPVNQQNIDDIMSDSRWFTQSLAG